MPGLSAIVTCKGRLEHLRQTLPALMATPDLDVVVVDYDCPDGAGDWVRASFPRARVVAVSDRPYFNPSEARNLGAAVAAGDWFFFNDADVHVAPTFFNGLQALLRPGVFLTTADPKPSDLWGALAVSRDDFAAIGGFDEAMEGYGFEDVDIVARLIAAGLKEASFPPGSLSAIPHDHAARTRFHKIANLDLASAINGFYRMTKTDLQRQGVILDLDARRKLHADVARVFAAPGGPQSFQIAFRRGLVPHLTVTASLRYDFTPQKPD
jgi:hypothetical protein